MAAVRKMRFALGDFLCNEGGCCMQRCFKEKKKIKGEKVPATRSRLTEHPQQDAGEVRMGLLTTQSVPQHLVLRTDKLYYLLVVGFQKK